MAADSGTPDAKGNPERRGKGFVRAGGLITPQLRSLAARRGFAQARLIALWAEIVGPDCAAVTRPVRLATARGPAGGLLTLAVSGAHAPQVQMLLPQIRERVNAALGPGTVGRILLTHAAAGLAEAPAGFEHRPMPPPDPGPLPDGLSSIGDDSLRAALETLARNVLSRTPGSQ